MSPLLFNLAIEPLAVALRDQVNFVGIEMGGHTHKLALYADDLLLFRIRLDRFRLHLIQFSCASGYKINLTKSLLFPINTIASELSYIDFPFKVATDSFTYLGVCVTQEFKGTGPVWASMERYSCWPLDPASLLCAPLPLSRKYHSNNPVVSSSLRIWSQFRMHFGFKQMILSTPIVRNPVFKPALLDSAFSLWF